eukprot:gb/GEZN01019692.1/.p1 GENE.gb/GEZN01019692.1/~~gb/GEZN01019692.1/.p1  ORF type:complete len:112 (+),score=25.32 gb/GEZN01019692.1/:327-662(+)
MSAYTYEFTKSRRVYNVDSYYVAKYEGEYFIFINFPNCKSFLKPKKSVEWVINAGKKMKKPSRVVHSSSKSVPSSDSVDTTVPSVSSSSVGGSGVDTSLAPAPNFGNIIKE